MTRQATAALISFSLAAGAAMASDDSQIERFLKIRTPGGVTVAADGAVYVRDWPDGIFQVYKREAGEGPEAQGRKLTTFEDGVSGYSPSPDGSVLLVSASVGGSEQDDLFLVDPASGELTPLYGDPNVVFSEQFWLRGSNAFVFSANQTSPGDFHLYIHDLDTGERRTLLDREGYWYCSDGTPDDGRFLVGRYYSASAAEVWEVDAATGEMTDLTIRREDGSPSACFPGGYAPGYDSVILRSDIDDGVAKLYVRDLASGSLRPLLHEVSEFEVSTGSMNRDKTLMAVGHNENGYGTLRVFDAVTLEEMPTPAIDRGIVSLADIEGSTVVFSLSNANTPGLSFAFDARKPELGVRPMTVTNDQGIDLSAFRLPDLVTYESFDGLEIPAFVYTPAEADRGPVPFVVMYHGGPEGQHRPGFSATVQYLVANGYGVMMPNVRGSTGYGTSFQMMDNYTKRWDSVRDGWHAAKWLVDNGMAEAGKIAAYGGSYGGFMAAAVPVEDTRRAREDGVGPLFGASVNVVGIVNFKTFLEQTKDYRRKLREAEYGPLSDPEFLASVSPLVHADDIRLPMLIAHGLNDPRVPVGEAMQMAVNLQSRALDDPSMEPELVYFPDEGHGFAKLDNRMLFYKRVVRFFDRTIGG